MSAAKKLGIKVTHKEDKSSILMAVAAGLLNKNIIKVAEGVEHTKERHK